MEKKLQILLFGDQTNSFDKSLRRLLQPGGSSAVTALLERVHLALRLEIGGLPISQQQLFPRFSSVSDLEARYRSSTRRASLESAFHCLSQLGWFIR
jgi:naphtho-gamma-pyrone polyketide synthase